MSKPLLILSVLFTSALLISSAVQEQHAEQSWDYGEASGPSHWGDRNPGFAACKTGQHQSPIDIRSTTAIDLPPIRFEYKSAPLHIIDNGHTITINYSSGSLMLVGEKTYALQQFHFHRPSEEKINRKNFDMSVHLVHTDKSGKLAVVAVLLQQGADNPLVRELWKHLPTTKNREERLDNVQIDVSRILPSDWKYYSFSGSLTTPPCSENVAWFVLKHPTTISADEIDRFSKLYGNNTRPTQPLYERIVLESK